MSKAFEGRVAVVTGGNSGIGRAAAIAFARAGARVVIAARRRAEGEETVGLIGREGGEACFVETDVSQADQVKAMVDRAIELYGRLDAAFNNAGMGMRTPLIEASEEDFDRVIAVNLKGVWLCMKYEMPHMLSRHTGAIVNTSSAYGLFSSPRGNSAYAASKHGVIGLTKAAALECAGAGVRVNAVVPGWVLTPMWQRGLQANPGMEERILAHMPTGRMGTPEETAEAVLWLCSDAASYVTGHTMVVDGGATAWGAGI